MECKSEKNTSICTCTYEPCPRKGRCCECIEYHKKDGDLPGCLFPPKAEKTYDRSVKAYIEAMRLSFPRV